MSCGRNRRQVDRNREPINHLKTEAADRLLGVVNRLRRKNHLEPRTPATRDWSVDRGGDAPEIQASTGGHMVN
jgi:hypothetical protein